MTRKSAVFPLAVLAILELTTMSNLPAAAQDLGKGADNFYRSATVAGQRVAFRNQYELEVVGTLFTPEHFDATKKYAAIVVGHPMGAVRQQSANLYAQKLAEQGFVTLSLDLSFWGESGGTPKNLVAPEIYAEDFSAAVDFLGTRGFVDRDRIGVLGVCGSGSFAISAAKIDPRLKAVATVSMYDMGAASRDGLNHGQTLAQRRAFLAAAAAQRYVEFSGGARAYGYGTVLTLDADTPPIQREFFDFYRTPRGQFTPEGGSPELTTRPILSSMARFANFYPFNDIETISPRPMLFITGDHAHSREFSEDAFARAAEPKELYLVPDAGHVDLYDRTGLIPWSKLTSFFKTSLLDK